MIRQLFPDLSDAQFELLAESFQQEGMLTHKLVENEELVRSIFEGWCNESEQYPFQRIVRAECAPAVEAFPLGSVIANFSTVERPLLDYLRRLELRVRDLSQRPLVASMRARANAGALSGDDSTARYQDFVKQCRFPGSALGEMSLPVWQRLMRTFIFAEASSLIEVCERTLRYRREIEQRFAIPTSAMLASYGLTDGDRHHRGRAVSILEFDQGSRLVYKPRPMSAEAAFAEFVPRFNDRYGTSILAADALDCGGFGFMEVVDVAAAPPELFQFFNHTAELLALMFLLGAQDMHVENVIQSANGPVAIDLETLLHPPRFDDLCLIEPRGSANQIASQSASVIGLLPFAIGHPDDSSYVDLSFLGRTEEGMLSPEKEMQLVNPFTDEMKVVFERVAMEASAPVFGTIGPTEMVTVGLKLATDFAKIVNAVRADRTWWCSQLRQTFRAVELRYIHNPTFAYSKTLQQAVATQALASPAVHLGVLQRTGPSSDPDVVGIADDEVRQMWDHDIPYFGIVSSETEVRSADGRVLNVRLRDTPLESTIAKFDDLTDRRVEQEMDNIALTFVSLLPDPDRYSNAPTLLPPISGADDIEAVNEDLEALAIELLDELVETVVPGSRPTDAATWVGPTIGSHDNRPWTCEPLGVGLHMGSTGPTIAMLALGRHLADDRYVETATSIIDAWLDTLVRPDRFDLADKRPNRSVFTGLLGAAWALTVAGLATERADWLEGGAAMFAEFASSLDRVPPGRAKLDVIGGLAGFALAARMNPLAFDAESTVVERLAQELLSRTNDDETFYNSGAAHGAAGYLAALAKSDRPSETVREATRLVWDQLEEFFDPNQQAWLVDRESQVVGLVWCHGSPGILAALTEYQMSAAPRLVEFDHRFSAAVDAAVAAGFGLATTWCHGNLSNYDVLRAAEPWVSETRREHLREHLRIAELGSLHPVKLRAALEDKQQRYRYSPGAMVGRSGVLLHILARLGGPTISPTRLRFESPPMSGDNARHRAHETAASR